MEIACSRISEKWQEMRTALLDNQVSQSNSFTEYSSQAQDCCILLPLHTNPIFYHGLIVSTGKIDLICKISPWIQEAFEKPSKKVFFLKVHCMCNFICPPSKCLSSVFPDWICQLKKQCKSCPFFPFIWASLLKHVLISQHPQDHLASGCLFRYICPSLKNYLACAQSLGKLTNRKRQIRC